MMRPPTSASETRAYDAVKIELSRYACGHRCRDGHTSLPAVNSARNRVSREIFMGEARVERDALKSHVSRLNKFHCEAVGAKVAPELLAEQNLHVGLIINHENKKIYARSPDLIRDAAARGRTIRNSVNSPGCVSTSMDPPCCLTMMS